MIINGSIILFSDAIIKKPGDLIIFHAWWLPDSYMTWTYSDRTWTVAAKLYYHDDELLTYARSKNPTYEQECKRIVQYVHEIVQKTLNPDD